MRRLTLKFIPVHENQFQAHGWVRPSLGPQIWPKAICPLEIWRRMIDLTLASTLDHLKKNNSKAYGGPGIRTQVLLVFGCMHLPLNHCAWIVNILKTNNNKTKQINGSEKQNKARYIQIGESKHATPSSLSLGPWLKTSQPIPTDNRP